MQGIREFLDNFGISLFDGWERAPISAVMYGLQAKFSQQYGYLFQMLDGQHRNFGLYLAMTGLKIYDNETHMSTPSTSHSCTRQVGNSTTIFDTFSAAFTDIHVKVIAPINTHTSPAIQDLCDLSTSIKNATESTNHNVSQTLKLLLEKVTTSMEAKCKLTGEGTYGERNFNFDAELFLNPSKNMRISSPQKYGYVSDKVRIFIRLLICYILLYNFSNYL